MSLNTAKHFEKLIGWYGSNKALYRVNVILEQLSNFKTEIPKTAAVIDKVAQNYALE